MMIRPATKRVRASADESAQPKRAVLIGRNPTTSLFQEQSRDCSVAEYVGGGGVVILLCFQLLHDDNHFSFCFINPIVTFLYFPFSFSPFYLLDVFAHIFSVFSVFA